MLFIVSAQDHPDALERRLACRQAHVDLVDELKAGGYLLMGGALLNDADQMEGSVIIGDFASKAELEEVWLKREPYVVNKVWDKVIIQRYSLGPSFTQDYPLKSPV